MASTADPPLDLAAASSLLDEVLALERELVEHAILRRVDALERARDAVRRIGDVPSPQSALDRAPQELGTGSELDRVLISRVADGVLHPHSLWQARDGAGAAALLQELRQRPTRLAYPLIEAELAQHQSAALVDVAAAGTRTPAALAAVLGWESYVATALTLEGATVGILHADATASGRAVDDLDLEVARTFAAGLAGVFERAALRSTLQRHREELGAGVRWMSARLGEPRPQATASGPQRANVESLTPRELEVLEAMARGQTNLAIAKTLVISEGTVKYHVKNVLRKLQATSRADAVARYLRGR